MTLREKIARGIVRRRAKKFWAQGAPAFASEDALFDDMWAKDIGLFRGTAFADAGVMVEVLEAVDHEFLDTAREGLPLESGTAAKFWLRCIEALKASE